MDNYDAILPHLRLKLEIEYPDYEDAWTEGFEKGQLAISESTNPYPKSSIAHDYWQDGWFTGFYNEPSIFTYHYMGMRDEVVGDITQISANDEFLYPKESSSAGSTVFGCLCAVFAGMCAYTIYDMAA